VLLIFAADKPQFGSSLLFAISRANQTLKRNVLARFDDLQGCCRMPSEQAKRCSTLFVVTRRFLTSGAPVVPPDASWSFLLDRLPTMGA
jgi:hypothetical protein